MPESRAGRSHELSNRGAVEIVVVVDRATAPPISASGMKRGPDAVLLADVVEHGVAVAQRACSSGVHGPSAGVR